MMLFLCDFCLTSFTGNRLQNSATQLAVNSFGTRLLQQEMCRLARQTEFVQHQWPIASLCPYSDMSDGCHMNFEHHTLWSFHLILWLLTT